MRNRRVVTMYGITHEVDVEFLASAPDFVTASSKRNNATPIAGTTVVLFRLYRDKASKPPSFVLWQHEPDFSEQIKAKFAPAELEVPQGRPIGYDLFRVRTDMLSDVGLYNVMRERISTILNNYGQQNDPSGVPPK
ncbi:MAG TPA: hypothetical protein VK540_34305 [Polyangiaceae bacterium]|nr:hypothetical protein [Polyangiaceae bacterium]